MCCLYLILLVKCLLNDKKRSKSLVQGSDAQKTFWLSSHTPEQFNVMSRTKCITQRFENGRPGEIVAT